MVNRQHVVCFMACACSYTAPRYYCTFGLHTDCVICLQLVAWAKYDTIKFPCLPMHGLNAHAREYNEEGQAMRMLRDAIIECAEGLPAEVGFHTAHQLLCCTKSVKLAACS